MMTAIFESADDGPSSSKLLKRRRKTAKRRRSNKYSILAVSLSLGLVSGTIYGYGRYSKDLKDALDLSHFEVELLGILLDTGNYVSQPFIGHIYDHYGPSVSCLVGSIAVVLSFGTIQLVVLGVLPAYSICLRASFFTVGFGSGLGYSAAIGSTMKNFESTPYRSMAIGLVAAMFALCSTLVGICYEVFGLERFFLFWAALVVIVNLVAAFVFHFNRGGLAVFEHARRFDEAREHDEEKILLLVNGQSKPVRLQGAATTDTNSSVGSQSTAESSEDVIDVGASRIVTMEIPPNRWEALRSPEFWILFVAFACRTGCGLFVFNNVSTMVQSIGGESTFTGRLVILLSVSNCAGRVLMGCLADRPNLNKLTLFSLALACMAVALFLSAATSIEHAHICLIVTVGLVAGFYGGTWVLVVGIVSDMFGMQNFGKNLGVIVMGPAFSGTLFNAASAWMYEQHAIVDNDNTSHKTHVCFGTLCYRGSFLLTGWSALICALMLWFLAQQTITTKTRTTANNAIALYHRIPWLWCSNKVKIW